MSKNDCDSRLRHHATLGGDLPKAVRDSRASGDHAFASTKGPGLRAAVVLVLAFCLASTCALAGVGSPLPLPSDPSPDQLAQSPRARLPVCQPTVPADDFRLTIVTVDGAVVTHETTAAIKEGFLAAQKRLERPWVTSEDFVFIAHPIQISEPQTGFWCGDGVNAWCGGYYEYRPDYQEFGKPEIHFVSDFLNPARVRALIDHEASHGIAHLAGCPNWYTIGHDGTDVCH